MIRCLPILGSTTVLQILAIGVVSHAGGGESEGLLACAALDAHAALRWPGRHAAVGLAAARDNARGRVPIDGRGSDAWTLPRRFSRGPAEPQAAAVAGAERRPVAQAAAGVGAQTAKSGSRPRCACCTPTCI